jgi:ribA/ribD-fused uncharacterized protein
VNAITTFGGEYAFLSNFYQSPIEMPSWHPVRGAVAPTVEHAFQSLKTQDIDESLAILRAPSPGAAKRMGRSVARLRPGWDGGRVVLMVALLRLKFAPGSELAALLAQTDHAHLVEGNTWGDRFWGVCGGAGENWLGRSLMLVRAELDVMPWYTNLPRIGESVENARINRNAEADKRARV